LIIQDPIRKKVAKQYGIKHKNTILIPNSYYTQFEGRYSPNANKYNILYSGGLEEWAISNIIKQISKLSGINITFSGWSRDNYLKKQANKIKQYPNITVLERQLSLKDYKSMVESHDIGLVWYSSNDENVKYIGKSSGKYFMYLSCGKPVIVQNLPGVAIDVSRHKLGVVIDSLDNLTDAIDEITENYGEYHNNIKEFYYKNYDYGVVSKSFFDLLIKQ